MEASRQQKGKGRRSSQILAKAGGCSLSRLPAIDIYSTVVVPGYGGGELGGEAILPLNQQMPTAHVGG